MAVISVGYCFSNIPALMTVQSYNAALEDNFQKYEKAVQEGSTDDIRSVKESVYYYLERVTVKTDGTLIFNYLLLVFTLIVCLVAMWYVNQRISKPTREADKNWVKL